MSGNKLIAWSFFICCVLGGVTANSEDTELSHASDAKDFIVWPAQGENVPKYVLMVSTNLFEKAAAETGFLKVLDKDAQLEIANGIQGNTDLYSYSFSEILPFGNETNIDLAIYLTVEFENNIYRYNTVLYDFQTAAELNTASFIAYGFDDLDVVIAQGLDDLLKPIAPVWYTQELEQKNDEGTSRTFSDDTSAEKTTVPLAVILHGSAQFFASASIGAANYVLMNRSPVIYRDWLRHSTNYEEVVTGVSPSFEGDTNGNTDVTNNTWIGYGFTGAGLALSSLEPYVFNPRLSFKGKLVYSLGLLFDGFGFTASHTGMLLYAKAERTYDRYLSGTASDIPDIYAEYEDTNELSQIMGITGLACALTSGIAKAAAPSFGIGTKKAADTTLKKILTTAGDLSIAAASITGGISHGLLEKRETAYAEYSRADATSISAAEKKLNSADADYQFAAIGAYSALSFGLALKITAIFLPDFTSSKGNASDDQKVNEAESLLFSVVPIPGGVMFNAVF